MKFFLFIIILVLFQYSTRYFDPHSDYAKAANYVKNNLIPHVDERQKQLLEKHGIVFGKEHAYLVHVELPNNIQYIADERDPRHSELRKDGVLLAVIFMKDTYYDQYYSIYVEDKSNAVYELEQENLEKDFHAERNTYKDLVNSYWKYSPWFSNYVCTQHEKFMQHYNGLSNNRKLKRWNYVPPLPDGIKCESLSVSDNL